MSIMANGAVLAVLHETQKQLRELGVTCVISPLSVPQGMAVSLHVAETKITAMAACVAAEQGGIYANASESAGRFAGYLKDSMLEANACTPAAIDWFPLLSKS